MRPLKELQRHALHCWPRAWTLPEPKGENIFHYISHVCIHASGVTVCSPIPSRLKYLNIFECWSDPDRHVHVTTNWNRWSPRSGRNFSSCFFLLSQDFRARLCGDSGYNEELIVSIMLSKTFSMKLRPSVVKISTLSSTIRVSPKDYIAPVSICWTDSNTFGKHESFTLSEDAWCGLLF